MRRRSRRPGDSDADEAVHPWYRSPRLWVELFALANFAGLLPDIYLAHSTNLFGNAAEYVPLAFSAVAPLVLLVAIVLLQWGDRVRTWRWLGYLVGWMSVGIGIAGMVLHLESRFFQEMTLDSLVYAAPFAAPLAYTGLGLLLIMNRMVPVSSGDWPMWVLLLALGGFVGNFVFSLTDHAANGFFNSIEWAPVFSSAVVVGTLGALFIVRAGRGYLVLCGVVLVGQVVVGLLGFYFHLRANLHAPGPTYFDRMVYGAPVFAPLLFPDLVCLAMLGLGVLYYRLPAEKSAGA